VYKKDGLDSRTSSIWVDTNTGSPYGTDQTTRITKDDVDAEQRFRTTVQTQQMEMFDTAKEAYDAELELRDQGLITQGVMPRRVDGGANAQLVSSQMHNLIGSLKRRDGFHEMTPKMQNELIQALHETSIQLQGSTSIQSRRLQRRNVRGASHDIVRTMMDYSQSSTAHLARLQHLPELDAAMKEMITLAAADYSNTTTMGRGHISNEIVQRVEGNNGHQEGKAYSPMVNRILSLSFIDKLASPAYSVVNATQPTLLTLPILMARYGPTRSVTALARAYKDIGALDVIRKGAADTAKRVMDPTGETTSFIEDIIARVSPAEGRMFRTLVENGTIDPEGGIEVDKMVAAIKNGTLSGQIAGGVDTSIGYLEGIARQMPKAVEAVNRTVSALAAYRLEMKRSGNHDAAVQRAQDVVNETQFNYSATNAPAFFNHPLARLAFQFKKFGLGVYQIIGGRVGQALYGADPETRMEALKSLGYIAVMHAAAAGALGLPTEPFKFLVMGANAAGLTEYTWGDVEAGTRELAAGIFGQTGGEIATRGLGRAFGLDVSSRLGLDNLMVFGEPQSNDTRDVWGWFTETAFGAPGGLVRDWHKGVNQLMDGDVVEAAEILVPFKAMGDTIKAYRVLTEGKKNATTGVQTMAPYDAAEAVTRAFGFTPAREAETYERSANFYGKSGREQEQRQVFMADWANGTPSDRLSMWGKIELFNRGKSRDERLTRSELREYIRTRASEQRSGTVRDGIRTNRRNRRFLEATDDIYNTQ
jgi:hypothetical protein